MAAAFSLPRGSLYYGQEVQPFSKRLGRLFLAGATPLDGKFIYHLSFALRMWEDLLC
jgi:hypothetical protein